MTWSVSKAKAVAKESAKAMRSSRPRAPMMPLWEGRSARFGLTRMKGFPAAFLAMASSLGMMPAPGMFCGVCAMRCGGGIGGGKGSDFGL